MNLYTCELVKILMVAFSIKIVSCVNIICNNNTVDFFYCQLAFVSLVCFHAQINFVDQYA